MAQCSISVSLDREGFAAVILIPHVWSLFEYFEAMTRFTETKTMIQDVVLDPEFFAFTDPKEWDDFWTFWMKVAAEWGLKKTFVVPERSVHVTWYGAFHYLAGFVPEVAKELSINCDLATLSIHNFDVMQMHSHLIISYITKIFAPRVRSRKSCVRHVNVVKKNVPITISTLDDAYAFLDGRNLKHQELRVSCMGAPGWTRKQILPFYSSEFERFSYFNFVSYCPPEDFLQKIDKLADAKFSYSEPCVPVTIHQLQTCEEVSYTNKNWMKDICKLATSIYEYETDKTDNGMLLLAAMYESDDEKGNIRKRILDALAVPLSRRLNILECKTMDAILEMVNATIALREKRVKKTLSDEDTQIQELMKVDPILRMQLNALSLSGEMCADSFQAVMTHARKVAKSRAAKLIAKKKVKELME